MSISEEYSLYKITNRENGNFYIGVTSHPLKKRWDEHVRHAKNNVNNGIFYRAIRKYGKNNFSVELLFKEYNRKAAIESEILLILELNPAYNSTLGGDGTCGHKVSQETRKKMGKIHIGNKYNLGRKWTEEQKLLMSIKKKGCLAPIVSKKMQETRIKNCLDSSLSRRKSVICLNDKIIYSSVSDAGRAYNLHKSNISAVCNGKRNSVFGLKFSFLESQNGHK